MTEVALRDQMQYASALAQSGLIPREYTGRPENVLLVLGLSQALGLEPAIGLCQIKVINGQPALSAQLQAALVRRAGHRLRIIKGEGQVTAQLIRADDPEAPFEATWTLDKARQAGLLGKSGPWAQYPEAMLTARAITQVIREGAQEVLLGCAYDPSELAEPEHPVIEVQR